jgi:PAS domain-containing protein
MNAHHLERIRVEEGIYTGRHYREIHSREESDRFEVSVKKVIESKNSIQEEYSHNGRRFIRRLTPGWNETLESVIAVTVISTDVTERKTMEDMLRISEESFRLVVESTLDSIYTVDPTGRYLFMNSHHKTDLG